MRDEDACCLAQPATMPPTLVSVTACWLWGQGRLFPHTHAASLAAVWHSLSCPQVRASAPSLLPPRAQGAACRKALPVRGHGSGCVHGPCHFLRCAAALQYLTVRKMSFTVLFSFPSACCLLLCAILGIMMAQNQRDWSLNKANSESAPSLEKCPLCQVLPARLLLSSKP